MHVFPQLRKLEDKYKDEITVVGVHSAKFTAEQDSSNVRNAVLRYEIDHPVVNDRDFEIWQRYGVRAWPTLMFIDPEGNILGKHEGEISASDFDNILKDMVTEFDQNTLLNRVPVPLNLEKDKQLRSPLSFPGKIIADPTGERLFIADSNHNRIVIASSTGEVIDVVGSGVQGLRDGGYGEANLYDPQGMVLVEDILYVADTKNHSIRSVDLANKQVNTVAGTGEQSRMFHQGGRSQFVQLNSPWDLTFYEGILYIAMAGFHQLWRLDLERQEVMPHAGNGRERIIDGPLVSAELAQPSGIVNDGLNLFFTDSETSAVRSANIALTGEVDTIVGKGLFEFGDVDGIGLDVRLQHPIGIEYYNGILYVADSYNNKIKKLDLATRETKSFLGSGSSGDSDGDPDLCSFREPAGLSVAAGRLFIADTNNHAIRAAELDSLSVTTLELKGL